MNRNKFMPFANKIYPYSHKNRFYNYPGEKKPPFIIPSIFMFFQWYLNGNHKKKINKDFWFTPNKPVERSENLLITWIGHSTFLIQVAGINILTDPIFGDLSLFFPRSMPPGIALKDLPSIDYVLLSHNHHDHMDSESLMTLRAKSPNIKFLIPMGDKAWFKNRSINSAHEFMWWESFNSKDLKFTFLPARHWSQRGIFDYNRSLWGSWMIESNGQTIYFAGDTYYSSHFKNIANEFTSIDIALMPIGPCEPNKYMKLSHINTEEACQAYLDLNAKIFIPMHFGMFAFGIDHFELPYERLLSWWQANMPNFEKLQILKVGESYVHNNQALINNNKLINIVENKLI